MTLTVRRASYELLRDVPGVKLAGQAGDVSESVSLHPANETGRRDPRPPNPGGSGLDVLRAIRPDSSGIYV